jgi:hypothetical protein
VWREQVRSRLADLRVELDSLPPSHERDVWREGARHRLNEAAKIIDRTPSLLGAWTGVDIEGWRIRIHAIEVALDRLPTPELVRAKLPGIIDDGSNMLGEDHPRVKILRTYAKRPHWDEDERECVPQRIRAIYEESDKENVRLRSFRNVLLGATLALAILAIGFAIFSVVLPFATDLFANPSSSVPPLPRLYILVIENAGTDQRHRLGRLRFDAYKNINGVRGFDGVAAIEVADRCIPHWPEY